MTRRFFDEAEVRRLLGEVWDRGHRAGALGAIGLPEETLIVDALLKGARTADPQNEVLEKAARHFEAEAKDSEEFAKDCCIHSLDLRLDSERDARRERAAAEYLRGLKA